MIQKILCKLGSHIWIVSHEKHSMYSFINTKDVEKYKESQAYFIVYEMQKCLCCKKEKRKVIEEVKR